MGVSSSMKWNLLSNELPPQLCVQLWISLVRIMVNNPPRWVVSCVKNNEYPLVWKNDVSAGTSLGVECVSWKVSMSEVRRFDAMYSSLFRII